MCLGVALQKLQVLLFFRHFVFVFCFRILAVILVLIFYQQTKKKKKKNTKYFKNPPTSLEAYKFKTQGLLNKSTGANVFERLTETSLSPTHVMSQFGLAVRR